MTDRSMRGPRWAALCKVIKSRDGHACQQCGSEDDLTVDHVHPLASFTQENYDNEDQFNPDLLVTLCRSCNSRKQDKTAKRKTYFNRRWLDRL